MQLIYLLLFYIYAQILFESIMHIFGINIQKKKPLGCNP